MEQLKKEKYGGPLLSWDIYYNYYQKLMKRMSDKTYLEKFLHKRYCQAPDELTKCVNTYDAIVITDNNQVIKWVSSGFYNMTGYSFEEAVNKKPSFLQGPNTKSSTRDRIKQSIKKEQMVIETIVNYRKSGIEYDCEIHIEPVFNKERKLIHFIAFEKETRISF